MKKLVIFGLGLAVGGGAAYLYMKNKMDDILEEETRKMIEEIDLVKRSLNQETPSEEKEEEPPHHKHVETSTLNQMDYAPTKRDNVAYNQMLEKMKYNEMIFGKKDGEEDEVGPDDINESYHQDDTGEEKPYVIPVESFMTNHTYEKLNLWYYSIDGVLANDEEEVIEDPELLVGKDYVGQFGMDSGDDDVVFIRNESMKVDYEIIRSEESYSEVILGLKDGDFVD